MSIFLCSCEKKVETEVSLLGEWKSEYEIMADGSKNYNSPYSLLEFIYSDGFILGDNKEGNSIWFESINGDFEWSRINDKILMSVQGSESSSITFEFLIANVTQVSMEFFTPKGHRYLLLRK